MLLDIRADHLQIVQAILKKHVPEHEVWAFGSRAKWVAKEYSDLDLCIVSEKPISFTTLGLLAEAFDESDLPYKVDVVDWATTSKSFRKIIEKDKVVVQKPQKKQVAEGSGSSEWPLIRLGDYVESCLGKMLDAKKNKGKPQPYLGNSNVRWGRFDLANLAEMKFEPHEEDRYGLLQGDLVVCEGGEPGRCAIWNGLSGMKVQKALHRIRPKSVLNNYYLFYWFCHAAKMGYLDQHFTGTTIKHLTGKAIAELKVALPTLKTQIAIVKTLKSLDDRITLLRETNSTLEAIAQALFKSWFVDFDPVHAKAEGRLPEGIDEASAALFPAAFVETELGMVPDGWLVKAIGDAVNTLGGGTPDTKTPEYWEPPIHNWTTPKDLSGLTAPVLLKTERKLSDAGIRKVSSGLLPAGTLLMSSRAPIGYLAISNAPVAINQGYIAIPPDGELSPLFMLFWCKTNMESIKSRANGSTFMEISKKAFKPIPALVPSAAVLNLFEAVASNLFSKVICNQEKIQSLETLRDTLLPRLISGRLQVQVNQTQSEDVSA
jgi:type I restriction enzyme, S subunit